MLAEQYAFDLLRSMVRIPSFSGNERKLSSYLHDELRNIGYATKTDHVGNLIAEIGAPDGPLVILMGHIDTVPSFLPIREADGKLFGRGTVDAKGPLAAFICGAALAKDLPIRMLVIGAVDEEGGSAGAKALRDCYAPDAVFIGEPSGFDGIAIGYKGQIKGRFAVTTAAGHSAGPTQNALAEVVQFWRDLSDRCEVASKDRTAFASVTPHLDAITGSPEHAQLHFDIRLPVEFDLSSFVAETASWAGGGNLEFSGYMPPALHSKDSHPARALRSSIRSSGLTPKIKVKTGTCDMNTVAGYWNAPCVAYGPGDSSLDHTTDEHINLSEYWSSILILKSALGQLSHDLTTLSGKTEFARPRQGTSLCPN